MFLHSACEGIARVKNADTPPKSAIEGVIADVFPPRNPHELADTDMVPRLIIGRMEKNEVAKPVISNLRDVGAQGAGGIDALALIQKQASLLERIAELDSQLEANGVDMSLEAPLFVDLSKSGVQLGDESEEDTADEARRPGDRAVARAEVRR